MGRCSGSPANIGRKEFVGVVQPYEWYAVQIGAVHGMAKFNLHGRVGSTLVNNGPARSTCRKPPAAQNPIRVGRALVDFELDVLGRARHFFVFDYRNHRLLRYANGCHSGAGRRWLAFWIKQLPRLSPPLYGVAFPLRSLKRPSQDGG